jgi:hypothetical protein
MLYALIVLFSVATAFFMRNTFIHVYILPYAMVPIFIRVFMDSRTAFMTHVTMVLICAVMLQHPFEFIAVETIAGLVAITSLRELSQRSQLFKTAFIVTAVAMGVNMAFDWMNADALSQIDYSAYNYLGANGITIKTQNGKFDNYEDDEWDGNLSALTPGEMYKIQVNNDCGFVLSGKPIFSASITIEQGHNWFGYTGLQPVSIEQALNGFTPTEGDRITSFDGKFTSFEDGEWGGNLSQLQPGQGYVYHSNAEVDKTLVLP